MLKIVFKSNIKYKFVLIVLRSLTMRFEKRNREKVSETSPKNKYLTKKNKFLIKSIYLFIFEVNFEPVTED